MMRIRTELWMVYISFDFDSGVLGEFQSGRKFWIDVNLMLESVLVLFNDFNENISLFELDIDDGLNTKGDQEDGEKKVRFG